MKDRQSGRNIRIYCSNCRQNKPIMTRVRAETPGGTPRLKVISSELAGTSRPGWMKKRALGHHHLLKMGIVINCASCLRTHMNGLAPERAEELLMDAIHKEKITRVRERMQHVSTAKERQEAQPWAPKHSR